MDIGKFLKDVWYKMWYTDLFSGKEVESLAPELENYVKKVSGSGLTAADKESAALQYEYQKQSMDYSNAINRQNLLDQASLEVEGYKSAGLNPALMYSSGIGSGVSSPNAGNVQVPVSSAPSQLISLLGNVLLGTMANKTNMRIAEMQNATTKELGNRELDIKEQDVGSNVGLRGAQAESYRIANRFAASLKRAELANIKSNTDLNRQQIKTARVLRQKYVADIGLVAAQTKSEENRADLLVAQAALERMQAWQIAKLTMSMETLNRAGAARAFSESARIDYGISKGEVSAIIDSAKANAEILGYKAEWQKVYTDPDNILEAIWAALHAITDLSPIKLH